jgi:hypothetical protein
MARPPTEALEKAFYKLDKWKKQYAKPELGIK